MQSLSLPLVAPDAVLESRKRRACRTNCIYLAKWKRHDMLVVLKIYSSEKLSRSQTAAAWQEAQLPVLLTSCGVPNICKVHWAFQQRGVIVVVQQYCERAPRAADSYACLACMGLVQSTSDLFDTLPMQACIT